MRNWYQLIINGSVIESGSWQDPELLAFESELRKVIVRAIRYEAAIGHDYSSCNEDKCVSCAYEFAAEIAGSAKLDMTRPSVQKEGT